MTDATNEPKLMKKLSMRIETQFSTPPKTTALQKLFMIVGFGSFIALASLTASLPLQLPSHQDGYLVPTTSAGDTAWIIIATVFGFLAVPAIAYLFVNLYNIKSSTLTQTVVYTTSMVTFVWIVISFSLIYGKQTWDDKLLGFPSQFYMFKNLDARAYAQFLAPTIPSNIFAVFELVFAIITPTIVAAAVSERVTIYGFMTFIFVWHICIYAPIAFITWNEHGWLFTNNVEDFSGGIVVNQLAAITIIVLNLYLDYKQAPKRPETAPVNKEGVLLSALAYWFLSFGLNAGKAHGANSIAAQSVVNTIAGVFTSIFFTYLLDEFNGVAFSVTEIANAILLGVIATTPSSGYVTVGGSMVIVIITFLVVQFSAKFLLQEGKDDAPLSFANLYGIGGTVSFIFTALISYAFINPAGYNGITHGYDNSADAIRYHTATVLVLWPATAIAVGLCAFLVDLFVPLSKAEQAAGDNIYTPTNIGPFRPDSMYIDTADIYRQSSRIPDKDSQAQTQA